MSHALAQTSSQRLAPCAIVTAMLVASGGCTLAADANDERKNEELAQVSSAVGPVGEIIGDWMDFFGRINTILVRCDWSPVDSWPGETCWLPDGYIAIGGGVETEGDEPGGGLLWASRPVWQSGSGTGAWLARSKDHVYPYQNRVRTYTIGIRLKDSNGVFMSVAQLKSQMYIVTKTTSVGPGVAGAAIAFLNASPQYQASDILVGGGAAVDFSGGAGKLLIGSYPTGPVNAPNGWVAMAKDHIVSASATVYSYAIGMRRCPAGFGNCLQSGSTAGGISNAAGYNNGYVTTFSCVPDFANMAGVGALTSSTGAGRLLTDIIPKWDDECFWGYAEVRSKDHGTFDNTGSLTAYTLNVSFAFN